MKNKFVVVSIKLRTLEKRGMQTTPRNVHLSIFS